MSEFSGYCKNIHQNLKNLLSSVVSISSLQILKTLITLCIYTLQLFEAVKCIYLCFFLDILGKIYRYRHDFEIGNVGVEVSFKVPDFRESQDNDAVAVDVLSI